MDSSQAAQRILRTVFGFSDFRGPQLEVIETVLSGQSALLLMPTGMGKSLTYQIPARLLGGLTLVVSPLIALMKDQVDAVARRGYRVAYINSSLDARGRASRYEKLSQGAFELLYVTPERFRKAEFRQALSRNKVSLLAIDEAHCVSTWGHDFRPDYSRLGEIRKEIGNPPVLALTATATIAVKEDILAQLGLAAASASEGGREPRVFDVGIERPNLAIQVHDVCGLEEKIRGIVGLRHFYPGPAIVYVSLVKTLREISETLARLGLRHLTYHGQMNDKERTRAQEEFLRSQDAMMLATPAFGLGIDKPDVRLVAHAELPGSLEAYYQEIGRAGRDGEPAACALLFDPDDIATQMDFIKWATPDPGFIRAVYNLIARNPDRLRAEGLDFLRAQMNFFNRRDFRVETAVNLLERWGSIEAEPSSSSSSSSRPEWQAIAEPEGEFLDEELHRLRLNGQQTKLLDLVRFARDRGTCRMRRIQDYFGDAYGGGAQPCGICDVERPS